MVYQRPDGQIQTSATIPEELAIQVEEIVDENPEVSESELVRRGLRRELQARMGSDKDE